MVLNHVMQGVLMVSSSPLEGEILQKVKALLYLSLNVLVLYLLSV